MPISDIRIIDASLVEPFSPPASDYDFVSEDWDEAEYRCFNAGNGSFGGYWKGLPGNVSFKSWPYGELCVIIKGRVAVEDQDSARREFGAGAAFFIPAGFSGRWITLEPSEKIFVAIGS